MSNRKNGPQYLGADGRFTRERPKWMPPKGIHPPRIEEFLDLAREGVTQRRPRVTTSLLGEDFRLPSPKPFKTPVISEEAAKRIAQALHVMLSDTGIQRRSR